MGSLVRKAEIMSFRVKRRLRYGATERWSKEPGFNTGHSDRKDSFYVSEVNLLTGRSTARGHSRDFRDVT